MKICQIHPYKAPARDSMGAERVVESITKGLLRAGHEVVMKLHPESTDLPALLVEEVPDDCDIIHYHQWEPDQIDYDKYGKPWVVTIHGGGMNETPEWLEATKDNPNVICVSKFVAEKVGGLDYVWTSSEPDDFIYDNNKENYFLWMAGTDWGESKGLFSTIMLAKRMRFNLKIAGSGRSIETINQIMNLCDDKIQYEGSVNGKAKAKLLSKAKALILLTQVADACPTTFGEAMLSGTPVIGSENGAMPELINEKIGFVCQSVQDVAKAVLTIGSIDPAACRDYGIKCFTSDIAAGKYLQLYENMLNCGSIRR
jgi:glycosyltransferase involved in cell wall biosynthesis